jgi:hypothetical protein
LKVEFLCGGPKQEAGRDGVPLRACPSGNRKAMGLLHGDLPSADRHFTEALAKAPLENQYQARNGLYRARIRAGAVARTYKEFKAEWGMFEALAQQCVAERRADQLEALLAAHGQARPEDANLAAWDVELKWLKKDYEGALKLIRETHKDVFARPRFRWKRDHYLVRCLVKLGKSQEAIGEAESLTKARRPNPVLVILAHAAHGGAKEAVAAVEKIGPDQVSLSACYRDPDLGPMLKSGPFRAFRDKFPEPKQEMEQ